MLRLIGCFWVLWSIGSGFLFAQTDDRDNWRETWQGIFVEAEEVLTAGDLVKGESLILEARDLAEEQQDTAVIVRANLALVSIHYREYPYMDSVLDRVHLMMENLNATWAITQYYQGRANAALLRGDFDLQIIYIDSARVTAETSGDSVATGLAYAELANAYQNVDNFKRSLEMGHLARAIFIPLNLDYYTAASWANDGICHAALEQWDSSEIALATSTLYFEKVGNPFYIAYNSALLGKNFLDQALYPEAKAELEAASSALFTPEYRPMTEPMYNEVYGWMTRLYLATGEYEQAKRYGWKAYNLADSLGQVNRQAEALPFLLESILQEQPEATKLFKRYVALRDQLNEEQNTRSTVEFERRYKAEEAQRKVDQLNQEARESALREERNLFLIFLVSTIVLLAALVGILLVARSRYRTQRKYNELNRKALQLQINPHFFFNVLNSISDYITQNDQKSAHFYLTRFAKLMRLSLENSREDMVPLNQEMNLVEAYLQLEQLRNDNFDFDVSFSEDLDSVEIPPLMVQPFVENAVVHAFPEAMPHRGMVEVSAHKQNGFLEISVQDNGRGLSSSSPSDEGKSSLAIQILRERLEAFGKRKGEIQFSSPLPEEKDFPGTKVSILIPVS